MHESTLLYVASSLKNLEGATYMQIVRALSMGVETGELKPGLELPSQRLLAEHLGIHFTTVTRAYTEAKRRGLISSHPGRGTVISPERYAEQSKQRLVASSEVDLTAVYPPTLRIPFDLSAALVSLGGEGGVALFSARTGKRDPGVLVPAAEWLQPLFSSTISSRIAASAGARGALLALMRLVVRNGGTLMAESLSWTTIRTLASMFDIKLRPIAVDADGIVPWALEQAIEQTGCKVLYCVPNAQNPTNAVMSLARRQEIAALARKHDLTIFEDDVYGELVETRLPPLAELAPRHCYFLASLAKCLSPSLRVAYVVAPSAAQARELEDLLRLTMLSPAPVEEALTVQAMANRSAFRHIARVKAECRMRTSIVKELMQDHAHLITVGPLFLWVQMPPLWTRVAFVESLRRRGVATLPSDVFCLDQVAPPNAIRIATGSAKDQNQLRDALLSIKRLLSSPSEFAVAHT